MQVLQFIAPDPASALAQIHKQLGPEAVVLSVRPLPAQGMSRFLARNRRIEVLAGLPDKDNVENSILANAGLESQFPEAASHSAPNRWRTIAWLEAVGLLPANAEQLQRTVNQKHGASPPSSLEAEWSLVRSALNDLWRDPPPLETDHLSRPHVFIGPSGCGKTTVLCKWLTLAVLTEERRTRVWRLDGSGANTAEFLTIHCEMLGTPIERFWSPPGDRAELLFIDLPGVEAHDPDSIKALRGQLNTIANPRVHVVLNAAYETETLLSQWQAFAAFNPEDLILTHLDEVPKRLKLWNLVFGTNCAIRFLSAGQKIPGKFQTASPTLLLPPETPQ
jgi:flagellar biosynthesis GTPase FlhF